MGKEEKARVPCAGGVRKQSFVLEVGKKSGSFAATCTPPKARLPTVVILHGFRVQVGAFPTPRKPWRSRL